MLQGKNNVEFILRRLISRERYSLVLRLEVAHAGFYPCSCWLTGRCFEFLCYYCQLHFVYLQFFCHRPNTVQSSIYKENQVSGTYGKIYNSRRVSNYQTSVFTPVLFSQFFISSHLKTPIFSLPKRRMGQSCAHCSGPSFNRSSKF